MNKLFAISIAAVLLVAFVPNAAAEDPRKESHSYIPGPVVTVIWCSEVQHAWIPLEPTNPWLDNPDGWLFSGEPECAPHDAINAANEAQGDPRTTGGYGGAAYTIHEGEQLASLFSNTEDDLFGVGTSYQYLEADSTSGENDALSAGCGPQTITIPEDPELHWQSSPETPLYLAWVWVDAVGVDEDGSVCNSSSGMVHGTFTPAAE